MHLEIKRFGRQAHVPLQVARYINLSPTYFGITVSVMRHWVLLFLLSSN